jgi:hypothetical protein
MFRAIDRGDDAAARRAYQKATAARPDGFFELHSFEAVKRNYLETMQTKGSA